MAVTPFKGKNYVREVLIQTAAQWATNLETALQAFETGRESDTGKEKTGPGLWGDLPYDAPGGQIYDLTTGTPADTDLIAYNAQTAAEAATATGLTTNAGTVGATLIVGNKLYTIVASGATGPQINIGTTAAEYATNIANKVTTDTASTLCTCVAEIDDLAFTANTPGAAGNAIQIETDDPFLTLTTFENGADEVNVLKSTTVSDLGESISTAFGWTISNKTDNYQILVADSGTLFTNNGAAASKAFSLPTGGVPGITRLAFFSSDGTRRMTIDGATQSQAMIWTDVENPVTPVQSSGSIAAEAQNGLLVFLCIATNTWIATSQVGAWGEP